MKKLIRMMRFAHAAEIAAYHAYEGHWRSMSNQAEQNYIRKIALDELEHISILKKILAAEKSEPNKRLDWCGKVVGELIGFACFYTGWRLPMWVAGVMEKIGTSSYLDLAREARINGRYDLDLTFRSMAKVEDDHEKYFGRITSKRSQNDKAL